MQSGCVVYKQPQGIEMATETIRALAEYQPPLIKFLQPCKQRPKLTRVFSDMIKISECGNVLVRGDSSCTAHGIW